MNKSWLVALLVLLALGTWMTSGMLSADNDTDELTGRIDSEPRLQSVEVRTVQTRPIVRDLTLFGEIEAIRDANLQARTAGLVTRVAVTEGQAVKRGELLVEIDMGTREQQLDEARALLKSTTSEVNAARSLRSQQLQSQVQLEQIQATLASARARLAAIEEDIAFTRILAPFDGVISQIDATEGELLSPGTPVLSILDNQRYRLVAHAPQQAHARLKPGTAVRATLINGTEVPGTLDFIAPEADPDTRTFEVKATLDGDTQAIAAGTSATLNIALEELPGVHISPSTLSLTADGELGVKIVDADDTVRFVNVDIISSSIDGAWVGGIADGSRLITLGQGFVQAGMTVRAVPATDEMQGS